MYFKIHATCFKFDANLNGKKINTNIYKYSDFSLH